MTDKISVSGAIAAALAGLLAALLIIPIWGILATVIGLQPNILPVAIACAAGLGHGVAYSVLTSLQIRKNLRALISTATGVTVFLALSRGMPFGLPLENAGLFWGGGGALISFIGVEFIVRSSLDGLAIGKFTRDDTELLFLRTLRLYGFAFFIVIVAAPFYYMIVSSFKKRAELLIDPLDLSLNFSQGFQSLFVGYWEVIVNFNFGRYILTSGFVSLTTVIVTLLLAVPGAYAVSRLRFPGRVLMSNSILLIYMFPAIVLVIPLYSVFSQLGLRDTLVGLLIVYPAATLPVTLYMLQGYFRSIPSELEEAGLIDGCSRVGIIWRITLPLSVPALASVSIYTFMIAWNEFLFAFMFLDNPEIFTLSRGIVSLNSSEVPRQFLMAGAVIVTLPVMIIFLWLERFMVAGLTAGSVKG